MLPRTRLSWYDQLLFDNLSGKIKNPRYDTPLTVWERLSLQKIVSTSNHDGMNSPLNLAEQALVNARYDGVFVSTPPVGIPVRFFNIGKGFLPPSDPYVQYAQANFCDVADDSTATDIYKCSILFGPRLMMTKSPEEEKKVIQPLLANYKVAFEVRMASLESIKDALKKGDVYLVAHGGFLWKGNVLPAPDMHAAFKMGPYADYNKAMEDWKKQKKDYRLDERYGRDKETIYENNVYKTVKRQPPPEPKKPKFEDERPNITVTRELYRIEEPNSSSILVGLDELLKIAEGSSNTLYLYGCFAGEHLQGAEGSNVVPKPEMEPVKGKMDDGIPVFSNKERKHRYDDGIEVYTKVEGNIGRDQVVSDIKTRSGKKEK